MIDLKQGDCLELMKEIPDKSVDAIVTDPPYEYLKHKLDRPFDEQVVFNEWDRIVKDDGFLVFFGRGASFHRWNYLLNEMGWRFKEEIVWDKNYGSSPFLPIVRRHETVSILSKKGSVKQHKIPYEEVRIGENKKVERDIARIAGALNNPTKLAELNRFIETNVEPLYSRKNKKSVTAVKKKNVPAEIITTSAVINGMKEQSIIRQQSIHGVNQLHPTQKPVRLMERLLFCTTDEKQTILDPFMGSGSTGVACINTNRNFIGYELQQDYFGIAEKRINDAIDARGLFATDEQIARQKR